MTRKKSIIWTIEKERLQNIIDDSCTLREVVGKLGYSETSAGCFNYLKERVKKDNLDLSLLEEKRAIMQQNHLKEMQKSKKPIQEILVENSKVNRVHLKERMIKEGLLEEKCADCGLGSTWNGKPLKLQLEHKNGINDDNRLENLCLLCPNCHSQTPTFAGRKHKKEYKCISCPAPVKKRNKSGLCRTCVSKEIALKNRKVTSSVSKLELIELILRHPFTKIGEMYGVSDNAVRKWCKKENLPYRVSDIKAQKDVLLKELEVTVIRD